MDGGAKLEIRGEDRMAGHSDLKQQPAAFQTSGTTSGPRTSGWQPLS